MKKPLSLDYIRQVLAEYFADKSVRRIQVFSSHARGEATAESDLDLLIGKVQPLGWDYFGYAEALSQRLGIPVDMGSGVSDYSFRYIAKDLKTVYEPQQTAAA